MAVRSYWNMEKAEVRLGVQDLRITPMANSIVNQCVREAGIQPKCFLMEPANPGHARNTTTMLYVGTCPNLAVESPKRIDIEPQFSYHLPTWFRHTLSRFARNRHSHESQRRLPKHLPVLINDDNLAPSKCADGLLDLGKVADDDCDRVIEVDVLLCHPGDR